MWIEGTNLDLKKSGNTPNEREKLNIWWREEVESGLADNWVLISFKDLKISDREMEQGNKGKFRLVEKVDKELDGL